MKRVILFFINILSIMNIYSQSFRTDLLDGKEKYYNNDFYNSYWSFKQALTHAEINKNQKQVDTAIYWIDKSVKGIEGERNRSIASQLVLMSKIEQEKENTIQAIQASLLALKMDSNAINFNAFVNNCYTLDKKPIPTLILSEENEGIVLTDAKNISIMLDSGNIFSSRNRKNGIIWNEKGEKIKTIDHDKTIYYACASNDLTKFVTASADNTAKLWDNHGNLLRTLTGHNGLIRFADFSSDDENIVTCSNDNTAIIWNLEGEIINKLEGHKSNVRLAKFSPDNKYIITGSDDSTAIIWTSKGKLLKKLTEHSSSLRYATFSYDSKMILTVDNDQIRIWNISGNLISTLTGHKGRLNKAIFSKDNKSIVSVSDDYTARIWDIKTKEYIELQHSNCVNDVNLSNNGLLLVTASDDETARVWDFNGNERYKLKQSSDVKSAKFGRQDFEIVTSTQIPEKTYYYNFKNNPVYNIQHDKYMITDFHFLSDYSKLITRNFNKEFTLFNSSYEIINTYKCQFIIENVSYSKSDTKIIINGVNKTLFVDLLTNKEIDLDKDFSIDFAVFSNNDKYVFGVINNGILKLSSNGEIEGTIQIDKRIQDVKTVGDTLFVLADNSKILMIVNDEIIKDIDLGTKINEIYLDEFNKQVYAISDFSGNLEIWQYENNAQKSIKLHDSQFGISGIAFNADKSKIITYSRDGKAYLLNLNGDTIALLEHNANINDAYFLEKNRCVITVGDDGFIKYWDYNGGNICEVSNYFEGFTTNFVGDNLVISEGEQKEWILKVLPSQNEDYIFTCSSFGIMQRWINPNKLQYWASDNLPEIKSSFLTSYNINLRNSEQKKYNILNDKK
jgi:WD40 repeat protein